MLLYRSSFCLENLHLRLFYLFNGNFSEWSVLSLSLSVLFVFCSLTARGRRGQDQWGKATEWRLAHSCAKKKFQKKKQQLKQPTERTFWTRAFLFTVFKVPQWVYECVCVCVRVFERILRLILLLVVLLVTHHTHICWFFFWGV